MPEPANPNPLAELLEATGMTQTEFAQLTGSTSAQISLKSRGKRRILKAEQILFRWLLEAHRHGEDVRELLNRLSS
jgi:transcriptional regulator with XRE-family HTH domain